ncbi:hypothetical protein ACHAXS_011041, partial [Conticribra weissflogii]
MKQNMLHTNLGQMEAKSLHHRHHFHGTKTFE